MRGIGLSTFPSHRPVARGTTWRNQHPFTKAAGSISDVVLLELQKTHGLKVEWSTSDTSEFHHCRSPKMLRTHRYWA